METVANNNSNRRAFNNHLRLMIQQRNLQDRFRHLNNSAVLNSNFNKSKISSDQPAKKAL